MRQLCIWAATWSCSLISGRLDLFFSLTLCHALVACVLFASALSLYAPLPASYYQLVSLTAFIYWVLVLFVLTVLTSTIQTIMRMVRLRSGQLLQRVGVMLANPTPVSQTQGRRQTSHDVAGDNNSSSSVSWQTSISRQNNDDKHNNNNNDHDDETDNDYIRVSSDELLDPVHRPSSNASAAGLSSTLSPRQEKIPTSSQPLLVSSAVALYPDSVGETALDHVSRVHLSTWHSGTASQVQGTDTAAEVNVNNNNNWDDNTSWRHHNVSSNAGVNYSSNAGAEDVPRVGRRMSAQRPSRQTSSVVFQPVARPSRASTNQSVTTPPAQSSSRQSSALRVRSDRSPSADQNPRKYSSRELSIADQRSSTDQSLSFPESRRSAAQTRSSAAGDELRRSSASLSQKTRMSSARQSQVGEEVGRRRLPAEAQPDSSRCRGKGPAVSKEAARRSLAADAAARPTPATASDECCSTSAAVSQRCCEPMYRPARIEPNTCWCCCEHEIHDPALLDSYQGSRDGRLLSLPGFPRNGPSCNSCFTPCRPLPGLCSKTPTDCQQRCRLSSYCDCCCACPCENVQTQDDYKSEGGDEADGGVSVQSKPSTTLSETPTQRAPSTSRPSLAESFKSLFSRRSTGNVSRNNPAMRYPSLQHTLYSRRSTTRPLNTSANSSSAFDVYWSKFWDQITPHGETGAGQSASTINDAALSELKTFTGQLVESVIAKLKSQYVQAVTSDSRPRGTMADYLREEDMDALYTAAHKSSGRTSSSTCDKEPTILSERESVRDEDNDDEVDSDLRLLTGDVVERLYTAIRHRLNDDNHNSSNVVSNDIPSHVTTSHIYSDVR